MELLEPGNYVGKILDYGVRKTSKGDPAPVIAFKINEHKVFWRGSWNGLALDYTMKALLVCGLDSPSKLLHLAEGAASNVLDLSAEYDLVIEIETDKDKKYNRVRWINPVGSAKFKDAMTIQEFAPLLNQQNLAGEFVRVAEQYGFKLGTKKGPEIPF